jgi:Protein of unknown function (DUF1064)
VTARSRHPAKLGNADVTYGKSAAEAIAGHVGPQAPKRPKYGNKAVVVDGIRFDSKAEYTHYCGLKLLLQMGKIAELRIHPVYELTVVGRQSGERKKIGTFKPDFTYIDEQGTFVAADVKSEITRKEPRYRRNKKHFEGEWEIPLTEVGR